MAATTERAILAGGCFWGDLERRDPLHLCTDLLSRCELARLAANNRGGWHLAGFREGFSRNGLIASTMLGIASGARSAASGSGLRPKRSMARPTSQSRRREATSASSSTKSAIGDASTPRSDIPSAAV
jgi:hypothetical protein